MADSQQESGHSQQESGQDSKYQLVEEEISVSTALAGHTEVSNNDEDSCIGQAVGGSEVVTSHVSPDSEQDEVVKAKSPSPHLSGIHQLKWLPWKDSFLPVVTQNENGPCPLLALTNVLLMRGKMTIEPGETMVTVQQLSDMLGACLLESIPEDLEASERSNYEQNFQDAMAVFPKLLTGLDINVKFDSVTGFEFTQELSIFDLLEVGLYHGWLADPSDPAYPVVSQCSYNQLVETVISGSTSSDTDKVQKAMLAQQFLETTASQLTYHGLYELSQHVKEEELCVFFRNNHFNTLLKRNGQMLLLVTDFGFIKEYGHVWHILSDIDDSGDFLDATFRLLPVSMPTTISSADSSTTTETEQPTEPKRLRETEEEPCAVHSSVGQVTSPGITLDVDHELAMHLMQEQVMLAEQQQSQQDTYSPPSHPLSSRQPVSQHETPIGPPPMSRNEYEQAAQAYESRRRESRQRSLCIVS